MAKLEERYDQGLMLHRQGKLAEAERAFEMLLRQRPGHYGSVHMLGLIAVQTKRMERGVELIRKATRLNAKFTLAHNNLGNVLVELGRFEEAVASFDRAITLQPDLVEAHYNRGHALRYLLRLDDAIASYGKSIALKPDYADAYWNQSLCLLQLGRYEQGWRLFEWRKRKAQPIAVRSYPQPLWLGEQDIAGKTLFIYWEQGFGDTIQFCRYAKLAEARGARVIMEVQPRLQALSRRLSPTIEFVARGTRPAAFDYHCPLMSLPLAFGTTVDTVPSERCYLTIDEAWRVKWSALLPPSKKPRVGLVWSGSATYTHDRFRSIGLTALLPLFEADADFVCLQKEISTEDAAILKQTGRVAFYGDKQDDFADAAALVDQMDLVISVDTAVAHLAGAMGKPLWVLLPSDWRWLLDRDDSPWYASARLFRPERVGDQTGVIDRVKGELNALFGTK